MNIKFLITVFCLTIPLALFCQTGNEINKNDQNGQKQGKWIKKYPNGTVMYEGIFKDNHPAGEFRRYYENSMLKSLLVYSPDGTTAEAVIYHPNGFVASQGKYIKQKKEGKWKFFSAITSGYLVSEENYTGNLRNGQSLKFFPDSTIAEKVNYINDIKQGEWIQYYQGGKVCLKSNFRDDKVDGGYQVWFENGKTEFLGQYKNDVRDGEWLIYNSDGSLRYKLEYRDGLPTDNKMDIDATEYLDSLQRNQGNIADPEKTGIIK